MLALSNFYIVLSSAFDTFQSVPAVCWHCNCHHSSLPNQHSPCTWFLREAIIVCECAVLTEPPAIMPPSNLLKALFFFTLRNPKKVGKCISQIKQMDAERCHKRENHQVKSDALRVLRGFPVNSCSYSFQHLTQSLKGDNDGWESSPCKSGLSACWRCGDVVMEEAGWVSK